MKLTRPVLVVILLLLLPAFLLNLGVSAFIDDEGNRALVALEMWWSGNWVTPTHHGAYYYNKPPLWNWILGLFFMLNKSVSEWTTRLPMVLSLLTFSGVVYTTMRYELGKARALLTALFVLTCGRILLWESLVGLIDVFFSMIVYLLFWVVYYYEQQKKWWQLFLVSYLLMVVAYMLKGLPAIVFQGITLLSWLVYRKQWLQLFRWPHLISGLLSLVLLGAYYWLYHQYNDLGIVFKTLFAESSKRTATAYSISDTANHILTFPIQLFYHFLPWTVLSLSLITRIGRVQVWTQPFTRFAVVIGLANVIIYWLSPNFYPRYVLMLLPLYFGVILQAYTKVLPKWLWYTYRSIGYLLFVLALGATTTAYWIEDTQFIPYLGIKVMLLSILLISAGIYYHYKPRQYLFLMVIALLLFRIGFDLFLLPARAAHSRLSTRRESVQDFATRWQTKDVAVFYNTSMEMSSSFYLTNKLQRIVPRRPLHELRLDEFYIYNPGEYDSKLFVNQVDSFIARHNTQHYFYVGQLRTLDSTAIEAHRKRELFGY